MKKSISLALGALVAPVFLLGTSVATASEERTDAEDMFVTSQPENGLTSEQLMGSDIKTRSEEDDEESIGSISNLVLDEEGQVQAVIVEVGGFLGMGEKNVALAWDSLELTREADDGDYDIRADVDKERLEDAPEYESD